MKIQDYCETKKCDCSDCEINKNHESSNCEKLFDAYTLGYSKAIDDFYNALAKDLIWIKERFGDYVYTDLWCSVGTRAEQLKERGENEYGS